MTFQNEGLARSHTTDRASGQLRSVVGIGASAGGVEALMRLVAALPTDCGLAYVVVLHLSPEHESNLAALLQTRTSMRVLEVTTATRMLPNEVYVIPPHASLVVANSTLVLVEAATEPGRRSTIDVLFRSLAASYGSGAIGIVLSGSGNDGSEGVREIKRSKGRVIVQ